MGYTSEMRTKTLHTAVLSKKGITYDCVTAKPNVAKLKDKKVSNKKDKK